MTITSFKINGHTQADIQTNAGAAGVPIRGMALTPGASTISYKRIPRPSGIVSGNDRLTFAVDVCMVGNYLYTPNAHIVVAARINENDILNDVGTNMWHGTIAGPVFCNTLPAARVMSEGRASEPLFQPNVHEWGMNSVIPISAHTWYRYVIDSIQHDGVRKYECRVYLVTDELNNVLGPLLYKSHTMVSTEAICANTDKVAFANVSANSDLIVGRVYAHWSNATEWVSNP